MNIERRLIEIAARWAEAPHGRSRNDQIALDERLTSATCSATLDAR